MVDVIRKRKKAESEPVAEIKVEPKEEKEVEPVKQAEVEAKANAEVKPPPQPKSPKQQKPQQPKQQPTPKKKTFFQHIAAEYEPDTRFVFQLKSGIIVEGVIVDEEGGYVKVDDAILTSKHSRVKTEWVRMERNQIGHFHSFTTDIELIEPKGE
ncbi:MAG: hypothetical protein HQK63_16590 [Desulfamplus sp.]|nr:hypothetical protein [Desulfamplus sp.]